MSALKKLLWLVVLLPTAVVLIAFAVANRHPVRLMFDPMPSAAPGSGIEIPLYAVVLTALLFGVVLGGVAAWLGQAKWRRAARQRAQEVRRWQREAERLNAELEMQSRPRLPQAVGQ